VVFGKPNLILDLPGFSDEGGWVQQGVALNLRGFASFRHAVEAVLEDAEVRGRMESARKEYVQRHYYCLDGKATDRICDAVLSLATTAKR
jgi:hypothetical protein